GWRSAPQIRRVETNRPWANPMTGEVCLAREGTHEIERSLPCGTLAGLVRDVIRPGTTGRAGAGDGQSDAEHSRRRCGWYEDRGGEVRAARIGCRRRVV